MKDLGAPSKILGWEIQVVENGLLRNQNKFVEQILLKYLHDSCHPVCTPMLSQIVSALPGEANRIRTEEYRSLLGSLQYLATCCRPDICFVTNVLSQFTSAPSNNHLTVALRVLKYLGGTAKAGIKINSNKSSCRMITVYSDAALGGPGLNVVFLCTGVVPDCKTTTGYGICINRNLVIFRTRKQRCTTVSSTELEILAASDRLTDMLYLFEISSFLVDLFPSKRLETKYFGDIENTVRVLTSGYPSKRTRHVAIRLSHVLDFLSRINTRVAYIRSANNPSDVFTKHPPSKQH
jgi:hypothetical protein